MSSQVIPKSKVALYVRLVGLCEDMYLMCIFSASISNMLGHSGLYAVTTICCGIVIPPLYIQFGRCCNGQSSVKNHWATPKSKKDFFYYNMKGTEKKDFLFIRIEKQPAPPQKEFSKDAGRKR